MEKSNEEDPSTTRQTSKKVKHNDESHKVYELENKVEEQSSVTSYNCIQTMIVVKS